jgi:hypothetical protein
MPPGYFWMVDDQASRCDPSDDQFILCKLHDFPGVSPGYDRQPGNGWGIRHIASLVYNCWYKENTTHIVTAVV